MNKFQFIKDLFQKPKNIKQANEKIKREFNIFPKPIFKKEREEIIKENLKYNF